MDDYYQERSKKLLKEIEDLLAKFDVSTLDTPQNDPMEQCDQCIHVDVCALKISRLHGLDVSQCEYFKPERQWISVKDRLPTHGFVLVWCEYAHSVEIAKYKGSFWRTQERRYALNSDWVTHWMPLPEPPKGE